MGTKGYHSYRGRRGGTRLLGIIVLALILLAACVYLFLQRYVTFTDTGEVRLDLPFFQREETPPSAPNRENISVLEEPAGSGEPAEPVHDDTASGIKVAVHEAPGEKCVRCWMHSTETTADEDGQALCPRCRKVLGK